MGVELPRQIENNERGVLNGRDGVSGVAFAPRGEGGGAGGEKVGCGT
jgi:hypothetical protein